MGLSTSRDDVSGVGGAAEAYSAYRQQSRQDASPSSAMPTTPPPAAPAAKRARSGEDAARRRGPPAAGAAAAEEAPDVVPVVLEWRYGGANVSVTGAWDGWTEAVGLSRDGSAFGAGASFIAVLYLLPGSYQYKYLVDGNWQCNPSMETQTDALSNVNNILHVTKPVLEFSASEPLLEEAPSSPIESYDCSCMKGEEARADPPLLPDTAVGNTAAPSASYTLINHVSISCSGLAGEGCAGVQPNYMSATFRYKSKRISATYIVSAAGGDRGPSTVAEAASVVQHGGAVYGPRNVVGNGVPHLAL